MRSTNTLLLVAAYVPLVLAGSHMMGAYGDLPARVPVHWDTENVPNGWMTKAGFVTYVVGFAGLMNAVLLGAQVVPPRLIRFPHKGAWLSRTEARTELRRRLRILLAGGLVVINWSVLGGLHLTINQAMPDLASAVPYTPLQFTAVVVLVAMGFLIWTVVYMKPPTYPSGGATRTS